MHTMILQELSTVRGGVTTVTQNESGWIEVTPYQDGIFFLDVREVTGTATITFQTSPSKDEILFLAITTGTTLAITVTTVKALMSGAGIPLARWVRWQIAGTATWDAVFRVYVALNQPGM